MTARPKLIPNVLEVERLFTLGIDAGHVGRKLPLRIPCLPSDRQVHPEYTIPRTG
ncbi:MAG: hypothetical protein LBU24_00750 [Methanocalculaceae archaeon]|nr:hypothetical protein [Methanocalculaceae archaeon]